MLPLLFILFQNHLQIYESEIYQQANAQMKNLNDLVSYNQNQRAYKQFRTEFHCCIKMTDRNGRPPSGRI